MSSEAEKNTFAFACMVKIVNDLENKHGIELSNEEATSITDVATLTRIVCDRSNIVSENAIQALIADAYGIEPSSVTPESSFSDLLRKKLETLGQQ